MEWPEEKAFDNLIEAKVNMVKEAKRVRCFDTFFRIERHFT
ncbi:MAG: hypothetical protein QXT39_02250 [Conexivisphaerales archaeon]